MINRKHGLNLRNFHDLHKYSVEEYQFWLDLWQYLGIIYSVAPQKVVTRSSELLPIWFPGSRLNYAENLLRRNDDSIACTAGGESGKVTHYSFRELRSMVGEMSTALRTRGLKPGDRVAAIVTNSITAVVIALSAAAIGGIFSSTATDMGTQGILDRYRQIKPKFIFAETEVFYAGKTIDLLPKISDVVRDLISKGLENTILLPSTITGWVASTATNIPGSISLADFLVTANSRELLFEQLPFSHPLYILYSSGTSGPPKCIVHSAGGVLLQTLKDIAIGIDLTPDDTYFQYTTTGWMMWPFMLSGLAIGARIVLYDGSPFHPDLRTYLKFISDQGVSVLGTSPRFLAEVQGQGINPLELAPFDSLRTVGSTGAVLTPPMFEWTQQAFGNRINLLSASGGTDICAAFVAGVPSFPVYAGEIQGKALGMKVEVFDPSGNNIEHTGKAGELVVTRPHPSLPLGFWGDESGEKFRKAYFETYPGMRGTSLHNFC
jgi:acetoacetyl-CoA synthetase